MKPPGMKGEDLYDKPSANILSNREVLSTFAKSAKELIVLRSLHLLGWSSAS
jgi:hypothetical protein